MIFDKAKISIMIKKLCAIQKILISNRFEILQLLIDAKPYTLGQ